MDLGLNGKTALLMSSTNGLGFGCAQALAAEGVNVVINGRNTDRGMKAVEKLDGKAYFIQADISNPDERKRLYEQAREYLGPISILVTNADGPSAGAFTSKNANDWQKAFELVMLSAIDMVKYCMPDMVNQRFGRIVNISSTSAKEITPGTTLANSLKPGLLGALGTLARENSSSGVTVNSILPGPFDTDRIRQYAVKTSGISDITADQALKLYADKTPMKRLGTINEFGALCAFLCSQYAGYITGQSIVIDGGQVNLLF